MEKSEIEYTIQPVKQLSINGQELWQYRELFFFFTWRDIKVKYKQTLLGFLWAVLQPLLMMAVFTVFFSKALNLSTDNIPAPIFYFSGLLFWNLFSSGLGSAANSMVNNAEIIKKIYFPRLIIPISSILVAAFDFLMAFIIFLVMIAYYVFFEQFHFQWISLAYCFLAFFLSILTVLGTGTFLAALNVKYRDFRYIIPFLLQFLLFVTPVIYPLTIIGKNVLLKYILALNPMTGAMTLARAGLTGKIEWDIVGISTLSAICFFFLGIFTFRKMEAYFADIA